MNSLHKYAALAVLLLIFLCVAYGAHAYLFFAKELRNENVSESVRIGNRTYTVDKGVVFSGDARIGGLTALRALRVAYAKTFAGRSPLLGLEGTDPDALRANTTLLKKTTDEIALLQKTNEDAGFIRNALYPFDFLYALSSLESARKHFIASGSESDLRMYMRSFNAVFTSGTQDSKKLLDAFVYETRSNDSPKIVGFSGTITATSSNISLASVPDALTRVKEQATRRSRCLSGITWMCPALSPLAIPESKTPQLSGTNGGSRNTFEKQIGSILRSVAATTTYDMLFAPVRLERSACLTSLPSPYHVETSIILQKNFNLLRYVDDMYFIPTAGESGPVPRFLRDEYGLRYLKINPMTFYLCPYLIEDISVAHATLQAAALAKNYSDIPNSHRTPLLSGVPDSKDAVAYIREAIGLTKRESVPADYRREVLSVSLIFTQQSAGLDAVVAQIAYINAHDLTLAKEGLPFDLSAKTLFHTHTAAPSLFLFNQIGALSPLTPNTTNDWENLNRRFKSYSNLRKSVTDDALIKEILNMEQVEKNGL